MHLLLLVVLQADAVDQVDLSFDPVDMFFGFFQQFLQLVAGFIILGQFARGDGGDDKSYGRDASVPNFSESGHEENTD